MHDHRRVADAAVKWHAPRHQPAGRLTTRTWSSRRRWRWRCCRHCCRHCCRRARARPSSPSSPSSRTPPAPRHSGTRTSDSCRAKETENARSGGAVPGRTASAIDFSKPTTCNCIVARNRATTPAFFFGIFFTSFLNTRRCCSFHRVRVYWRARRRCIRSFSLFLCLIAAFHFHTGPRRTGVARHAGRASDRGREGDRGSCASGPRGRKQSSRTQCSPRRAAIPIHPVRNLAPEKQDSQREQRDRVLPPRVDSM